MALSVWRLLPITLVVVLVLSGCSETQPYVPRFANLQESFGSESIWTGDRIGHDDRGFHEYWLYGTNESFRDVRVRLAEGFRAAGWRTWPPNSTDDGWDRVIGALHPGSDFCIVYHDFNASPVRQDVVPRLTEADLQQASIFASTILVILTDQCA
jgi:hypothetical protein